MVFEYRTVEKDDVKIIKMFYDIPATVYGTIPYYARDHIMYNNIQYHTGSKKPGPADFVFSLFDAPFTVSTVLVFSHQQ